MTEEIKKEAQDLNLNLDDLDKVAGGAPSNGKQGGTTYKLPDYCPKCGAKLIKVRNAKSTNCLECGEYVKAVEYNSNSPEALERKDEG